MVGGCASPPAAPAGSNGGGDGDGDGAGAGEGDANGEAAAGVDTPLPPNSTEGKPPLPINGLIFGCNLISGIGVASAKMDVSVVTTGICEFGESEIQTAEKIGLSSRVGAIR